MSHKCQSNFFPFTCFVLNEKIRSSDIDIHLKLKYCKGNGMSASLACLKHNRRSSLVDSNSSIQFLVFLMAHRVAGCTSRPPFFLFLLPGKVSLLSTLAGLNITRTVSHGKQHPVFCSIVIFVCLFVLCSMKAVLFYHNFLQTFKSNLQFEV